MVPVLIHAGSGLVLLDDLSCLRAACDGLVTPGRHHVTVKHQKDGEWQVEVERDVDITEATEIHIERPGFLRKAAIASAVAGGALALAGLAVPILALNTKPTVNPSTGSVRGPNAFQDTPTALQVAWIACIGVGISLALVGAVGLTLTSGKSTIASRRWAIAPSAGPVRHETRDGSAFGLGFAATF